MYIHSTNNIINKNNLINVKQPVYLKPKGYWYANNNDWIVWAKKNMYTTYKYKYEVKINYTKLGVPDKHKILLLKNRKDIIDFTIKFGNKLKKLYDTDPFDIIVIDWIEVAKLYGGIEIMLTRIEPSSLIAKKFKTPKGYILWIDSFDIQCGCVWNVKSFEVIKKIN